MKDGNDDQNKKEIVKRTSIANQGVVSNYRKLQREAMRLAKSDVNNIPDQIWYDSLRETDDGRFSETGIFENDLNYQKQVAKSRNDYLKQKFLNKTSSNTNQNII